MLDEYLSYGQAKIVVKAQCEEDITKSVQKAKDLKVNFFENVKEGKDGKSVSQCLALGPDRSSKID